MKKLSILTILVLASITIKAQTPAAKHLIKYLEINTTKSDYGLALLDNDKVVFAMPLDENSKKSESDLFIGDVNEDGKISNKHQVKGIRHIKKVSKTGVAYSKDLKTVYFSAKKDRRKKSKEKDQLFRANIDASGNWINIQKLPFNSEKYSTGQPALGPNGKKLYFVSNRPYSNGGNDIYVVDINQDGTYSEPKNLGNKINTHGDEITPFITNTNMLYFSSNGHEGGLGNLDVYASQIINDQPSDPIHLDAPINSINDDFAYILNKNNDAGYFSSNRLQGQNNDDIYSFILEEIKPEKCIQEIAGIVKDKESQEILNDAAMTLFDEEGNKIKQIVTDQNGAYKFTLDCNQTYTLVASSLYYNKDEHIVNTANYINAPALEANKFLIKKSGSELQKAIAAANSGEESEEEAPIKEIKENEAVVAVEKESESKPVRTNVTEASLSPIYFGFDKSNITTSAAKELDKLVTILDENDALKIEVSSYTDARGSSAYNLKLSDRRAKSTVDYLVSKGISRGRIVGHGYGESRMINKCIDGVKCSEQAHAKNRRTEFAILNSQTYMSPVKVDSNKSATPLINKKNIVKKSEKIVAKHLIKKTKIDHFKIADKMKSEDDLLNSIKKSDRIIVDKAPLSTEARDENSLADIKDDNYKVNETSKNGKLSVAEKSNTKTNQIKKVATSSLNESISKTPTNKQLQSVKENNQSILVSNFQENNEKNQTNNDTDKLVEAIKKATTTEHVNSKLPIDQGKIETIKRDNSGIVNTNDKTQLKSNSISFNEKGHINSSQLLSKQELKKKS